MPNYELRFKLNELVIIFNTKVMDNAVILSARQDQLLILRCHYIIPTNRDLIGTCVPYTH